MKQKQQTALKAKLEEVLPQAQYNDLQIAMEYCTWCAQQPENLTAPYREEGFKLWAKNAGSEYTKGLTDEQLENAWNAVTRAQCILSGWD